jgi:hypothetical protein
MKINSMRYEKLKGTISLCSLKRYKYVWIITDICQQDMNMNTSDAGNSFDSCCTAIVLALY